MRTPTQSSRPSEQSPPLPCPAQSPLRLCIAPSSNCYQEPLTANRRKEGTSRAGVCCILSAPLADQLGDSSLPIQGPALLTLQVCYRLLALAGVLAPCGPSVRSWGVTGRGGVHPLSAHLPGPQHLSAHKQTLESARDHKASQQRGQPPSPQLHLCLSGLFPKTRGLLLLLFSPSVHVNSL